MYGPEVHAVGTAVELSADLGGHLVMVGMYSSLDYPVWLWRIAVTFPFVIDSQGFVSWDPGKPVVRCQPVPVTDAPICPHLIH